jgi:rfaE bifunctional protein nucleotidyltransferase chain/domain
MSQVVDKKQAATLAHAWQALGLKVVFTNGVFDILHRGHVDYLESSRSLGDKLIVGINNDASVRRLGKGEERPINHEDARAKIVSSLRCVDAVVLFDQDTPLELILEIAPDILVKGGDYDPEERNPTSPKYMVGSAEVFAHGGEVVAIPLTEGYSTTNLVRKLRKP